MSLHEPVDPPTADGYLHEVGFYGSEAEFRDLVLPFAFGALEADEPVVFAYDPRKTDLLHEWLPAVPTITYVTDTGPYATPARALRSWRRVVERQLKQGANRVRIAGDVPHPGYGRSYAGWDRYEAAIDRAWGDLPVWAPCLYDTRITPDGVLAAALRHHRRVLGPRGEHLENDAFRAPAHLREFLPMEPGELTRGAPMLELVDPTPAVARSAARQLIEGSLSPSRLDELLLALTEAVANASIHGIPPVSVRLWARDGEAVIRVHDHGHGPADPLAGLFVDQGLEATCGRGLWIVHQLDLDVGMSSGDGFSVILRGRSAP